MVEFKFTTTMETKSVIGDQLRHFADVYADGTEEGWAFAPLDGLGSQSWNRSYGLREGNYSTATEAEAGLRAFLADRENWDLSE